MSDVAPALRDPTPTAPTPMVGLPKAPVSTEIKLGPLALPSPDPLLFAAVIGLVGFGVVMVYSASAVYAAQKFGSSTYFLRRDLLWTGLGLSAMTVALRTDYAAWRRWAYALLGVTFTLLVSVLFVGARINGAKRWFHLGPLSFQPAELAKLSLVIYLAYSLAKKAEKVRSFTIGFVPHMIVCGVMMVLLLKQPDLGTAVILGMTTLLLLFVAGAKLSYIVLAFLGAAPIVYQAIVGTPWRMRRMLAYLDPWQYRYDVGYQITESLISIGSGGVRGLGLGDGRQKLFFLPEAHTDFVLALVGEELGFLGTAALMMLFLAFLIRGFSIAARARMPFGYFLGMGVTLLIATQTLINAGVVTGLLPTKGLTLPFVSYGGSSLVISLIGVGMLLSISRDRYGGHERQA